MNDLTPVPGWPAYYGDTNGDVWSNHTGELRRLTKSNGPGNFHRHVGLYRDGQRTITTVANVILLTYVGPRPPKHLARHLDNDPLNTRPTNLKWATRAEIAQASVGRGTHKGLREKGEANPRAKLCEQDVLAIRQARAHGVTNAGLAKLHGVRPSQISNITMGHRWKHLKEVA
jgi:hypothetical protein